MSRDEKWMKRHTAYLAEAKEKAGKVDSITDGWHRQQRLWAEHWEPLKVHNIGIGGERTQHVLWRLQNGEVAGLKPEVTVL